MNFTLEKKPFSFSLLHPLKTSHGILKEKKGWLIHLSQSNGLEGWGEVAPINLSELKVCDISFKSLGKNPSREALENGIRNGPCSFAFGIGAALAELDGLIGARTSEGWLKVTKSAILLPTDNSLLIYLEKFLEENTNQEEVLTFKWKVGVQGNKNEKELLNSILQLLPSNSYLRIDANAGWNFKIATEWADSLINEPRLQWLEQPLNSKDISGLEKLSKKIPIALDESILENPLLRETWQGWQVRRPLLEGDPRILLEELKNKIGYRTISTSFETGIGGRWVHHLAALQQKGPTPTVPGLASHWYPNTQLFSNNPKIVWDAA